MSARLIFSCFDAIPTCFPVCVHNGRKQAEQGPEALSEPALPEVIA